MNLTTQALVDALPKKKVLTPVEIAGVFGKGDGSLILAEIKRGRIAASHPGDQFFISYAEAVRYIEAVEYKADEA